jgi:hypothetical protein
VIICKREEEALLDSRRRFRLAAAVVIHIHPTSMPFPPRRMVARGESRLAAFTHQLRTALVFKNVHQQQTQTLFITGTTAIEYWCS